jgi:hypothetical protein
MKAKANPKPLHQESDRSLKGMKDDSHETGNRVIKESKMVQAVTRGWIWARRGRERGHGEGRFSGIPSGPLGQDALWDLLDHSRMGGAIQFCTD